MTVVEGAKGGGLPQRVQNMLLRPSAEWDVIDGEPATVAGLMSGYVAILAAIGPIATILITLLIGRWLLILVIAQQVVAYMLSFVGVYIVSFIVDALAPSFGVQKNHIQSMKLITYANTAAWVAGVFNLIPIAGVLGVLAGGIYSLYTLYIGFPKVMKSAEDKTMGYFLATLGLTIAFYVVVAIVLWVISLVIAVGAMATGAAAVGAFH
ncbi:MAG TPA: Yip1 family protein [Caulobacteraceae bacterium]|nr:Yip1 family protein [Caulobacteraceae bacterium]